jgi:hypothetical protein
MDAQSVAHVPKLAGETTCLTLTHRRMFLRILKLLQVMNSKENIHPSPVQRYRLN